MHLRKNEKCRVAPNTTFVKPALCLLLAIAPLASCKKPATSAPARKTLSAQDVQAAKAKAEQGDAEAQSTLGDAYANGEGVQQDYTQAAKWYRQAAEAGKARAQAALGDLYEAGQGVPQDDAKAATWYRRAAERGLASAQYELASLYAVGKGVPMDNKEALNWYLKAANQGDRLAQYNVGMRYSEGHGVRADPVLAYKWLRLASGQGLPDATHALDALTRRMSSEQLARGRDLVRQFKGGPAGASAK
jgi:uncharacterized protein